ncbi:MAG: hypothetical protein ACE148_06545 [Vicinamibacterales bacterium]
MNEQSRCEDKSALLALLYGEASEAERRLAEEHVVACEECERELRELGEVRDMLGRWTAPPRHFGFRIVRDTEAGERRAWWARPLPAWSQAAAAVLLLSAGAAIANLDIRYGADGLAVTTGWHRTEAGPGGGNVRADAANARAAQAVTAPWREDLAELERQLRTELASARTVPERAAVAPSTAAPDEGRIMRRVEALITASEERQRRELAIRNIQLARDLRGDLTALQRGLVQLDGRSDEMLNYLMRVSQVK